jgi:lysyl-tRNA synthetase, class II
LNGAVLRRLPPIAGAIAFAIGVVNLVSALTPNLSWRGDVVVAVLPEDAVPLFHTLAVPTSIALIVCSLYLRRRRRRAWAVAFALLVALGAFDVVKGFDVEEALLTWAGAAVLWFGRGYFYVEHGRIRALRVLTAVLLVAAAAVASLVWLASGRHAEGVTVLRQTMELFSFTNGSMSFHDELSWLPLAVSALTVALIIVGEWLFFSPRPAPRTPPDAAARRRARALIRVHGTDTLAFFKLRRDLQYVFARDGRAFLGYRIENGVLIVAGDPVGPADAVEQVAHDTCRVARIHGLHVTAIGASSELLPVWRACGLRAIYIGDEALVNTATFSLEGRTIRKVRQSVHRLSKAGYTVEVRTLAELDRAALAELEDVSSSWRGRSCERGFAMTMDALGRDGLVVVARDSAARVRGFLHFVPTHGRPALSLLFMRRDRETPNGLMEFLVVRAIELLRERGVEELSLNFVMFGRLFERPLVRRVIRFGSRWFQIESLYRFSTKFAPRWEPRHFVFDGLLSLPRSGLAALWVEGQLPRVRSQPRASRAIPAATSTAPAKRAGPTRSRRKTAASTAAMTTPVSRTAETDGAGARRSARSTRT